MDPMALVTQYNLLQNGPPEESKLATYMVCQKLYVLLLPILNIMLLFTNYFFSNKTIWPHFYKVKVKVWLNKNTLNLMIIIHCF